MQTGVFFLLVIVVFCVCLGFAVATAIMYRREIRMLKQVSQVNANALADMSQEVRNVAVQQQQQQQQPDLDLSKLMDADGMSALVDAMAKQGK